MRFLFPQDFTMGQRRMKSHSLNGVRVAVKDLFDIAGVRTGCGQY